MADSRRKRPPKYDPRPLNADEGARVLLGAAWACALIGLGSLLLELWSEAWLAEALGLGVFVSLPLAVGGAALAVVVARRLGLVHALGPALITLVYAAIFGLSL